VSPLLSVSTLAALLIVCAEPAGGTGADLPAYCSNYSTGSDTHTACAPPGSAPQDSTVACHNYTVGSDTHAECAPAPAPRLSAPREKKGGLVPPPASALRCSTYHIGSTAYTDCR
jgi:hypothetical protein